jgi:hypothetical protein
LVKDIFLAMLKDIPTVKTIPDVMRVSQGGVPTMLFSEHSSGSLPALTYQSPKRCYHAE